jgi:hypothetical protein
MAPIVVADHPTLGIQQDAAGSITTLSAVTLPKGATMLGLESQYVSNNEISDADLLHYAEDGEEVHSVAAISNFSLNAAWGPADNLTVGFNLPHVTRTNIREGAHHNADAGHDEQFGLVFDSYKSLQVCSRQMCDSNWDGPALAVRTANSTHPESRPTGVLRASISVSHRICHD